MYFRSLHHNELNIGIFNRNALTLTGGFYFSWFRIHSFRAHTIRMGLTDRIRPGGSIYPGKLPAISREIPPEMRLPIQDSPGNSPGNFPAAPPNFPGNPRRIHRLSFPWILPGGIPGKCPEFPAKWISLEMDFPRNSPGNFPGNGGREIRMAAREISRGNPGISRLPQQHYPGNFTAGISQGIKFRESPFPWKPPVGFWAFPGAFPGWRAFAKFDFPGNPPVYFPGNAIQGIPREIAREMRTGKPGNFGGIPG